MEFGVFLNGYIPGPAAHIPELEHQALMMQAEVAIHADKNNWKYAWFGEHHGLAEYSHLSAPEVMMGYVAARTEQIHLSTGITSLPTVKEHPVRIAERAAMLDHMTEGRFEFGTGRGAGSHEVASFNGLQTSETKAMWNEVVREIPRMWAQKDYTFEGDFFSVPTPHNVLPKPYMDGHPPIWVAAGNPPTFQQAGSLGIGAIAFNYKAVHEMKPLVDAYKEAAENPVEIIGDFQNNSLMLTNAIICLEDRDEARRIAMGAGRGYLATLLNLYHDTMPKLGEGVTWPDHMPNQIVSEEILDMAIDMGFMLCGNPEEVATQFERYATVGFDQIAFAFPNEGMNQDQAIECIELMGDQVIPEFDKDEMHRTTRFRQQAEPKFPMFSGPVPEFDIVAIPEAALAPLN